MSSISMCNKVTTTLSAFKPKDLKEWAAVGLCSVTLLFSGGLAMVSGMTYLGYKSYLSSSVTNNPNEVRDIYKPNYFQIGLPPIQKINRIQRGHHVIGITSAQNRKTKEFIPIYIRCETDEKSHKVFFSAYRLHDDKYLGHAVVLPFLTKNNYLRRNWLGSKPEHYIGYGADKTETSKVSLEYIQNESDYKYVGFHLIKAIQQYFKEECQGKMMLEAAWKAHTFYYKLGFRAFDTEMNQYLAGYVNKNEQLQKGLKLVSMYLPDDGRKLWLKEIEHHPIGLPNEIDSDYKKLSTK